MKNKLKSRKFWLTILAQLAGGYLIANGHPEAGAAVIGLAQGSYNIGQGMADAKDVSVEGLVKNAIEGITIARQN